MLDIPFTPDLECILGWLFTTLDVWKNVVADETNYKTSYSCRQCVVYSFTPFNIFNTPLASYLESNKQISMV